MAKWFLGGELVGGETSWWRDDRIPARAIEDFFDRSRVRRYCKILEIFMACLFFSISSGKLEIAKVLHKTRISTGSPDVLLVKLIYKQQSRICM